MREGRSLSTRTTTFLVLGIVLAASSALVIGRLAKAKGDASAFVDVGRSFTVGNELPAGIKPTEEVGFDGQFYFRLSLNPLTSRKTQFGLTFDQPSRRQQRILYPVIAWMTSGGGHPRAALWSLIFVNVGATLLAGWAGTELALSCGRTAWAGLFFGGVPALLISLSFDTAECVSLALLLVALLLIRKASFGWATLALTSAALTRETTLIVPVGLLLATIIHRLQGKRYEITGKRVSPWVGLTPVVAYGAWATFLWAQWGEPPWASSTGGTDLGLPIVGFLRALSTWHNRGSDFFTTHLIFAVALVGLVAVGVASFKDTAAKEHERAAFVLALVLLLLSQRTVWFHYVSFLRTSGELFVLGLLLAMHGRRPLLPVGAVWAPLWLVLFKTRVLG
jgi:hypothetical protein